MGRDAFGTKGVGGVIVGGKGKVKSNAAGWSGEVLGVPIAGGTW